MFRSARWRSEKNKIKAVFKLQFHATQVSEVNANAMVISVVPGDVGKPTARLEKGIIRDGCCRWEYPVYETVKFVRDAKTGKINERLYHFIVSTGLSKSSLVGEVSIDFADYADSTKVSTVSLPLKNTKTDAVLHVFIQRMQENGDQREEDSEDTNIKSQNRTLNTFLSNDDGNEGVKRNSIEDEALPNATTHNTELNDNCGASSGSDITMSSSESSSGLNTPRELGLRNNLLQDPTSFLASRTHISAAHLPAENAPESKFYEEHRRLQWDWSADSDHGISTDGSLSGPQSALMTERSPQASEMEIEKLKAELVALSRKANVSDLELQTLRKQIVKESKKGQDLSREVTCLKEERDALKAECEKLEAFQKRIEEARSKNKSQFEGGDPRAILDEIRQELTYEKDINSNLRLQLQKTQESNAELILAVQDLDEMLEQKTKEIADLSTKLRANDNLISRSETDDEEQKELEELVKEHRDAEETCLLEQKVMDLSSEVEIYRRDKDELEMQMEQLALDYEILKQENHDMSCKLQQSQLQDQLKMQYECYPSFSNTSEIEGRIESLENELKMLSKEKSDYLAKINELENHIKSMEEELEKQAQEFEADLEAVSRARVEQEQRAIIAEEALRKTKWKNANTAEKLQEDFRKLSMQMVSTFDANEKVAINALAEVSELRMQKSQLEEMLQKVNEEVQSVRDGYETKLSELSDLLNLKLDQIEQMLVELDDKSKQLEKQKKHEEKLCGDFSQEISRLKSELERLKIDNGLLSELPEQKKNVRLELEQMKSSLEHTEELVQKGNLEKNELVSTIALLRQESEKSLEEFNRMKCLKDEKETAMCNLQSEVETLKAQCNGLKNSLLEDNLEKENLRKQVVHLRSDLKKKEDALTNVEKKLKESNKRGAAPEGTKNTPRNKSTLVPHGSKEVAGLKGKIKLLEGQIKLKETALEASANSFFEKERDLLSKIVELESRVEEINQNSASFIVNSQEKNGPSGITSSGITYEEDMRSTDENLDGIMCTSKENGNGAPSSKRNHDTISEEQKQTCTANNTDFVTDPLSSEVALLKERNKQMENELKEMQERYSEISLKFAEVEGERQQLVMTVRNLKNTKKS